MPLLHILLSPQENNVRREKTGEEISQRHEKMTNSKVYQLFCTTPYSHKGMNSCKILFFAALQHVTQTKIQHVTQIKIARVRVGGTGNE